MPPRSDEEVIRSLTEDPRYFIERCLYIVDQSSQRVPFLLNNAQADFMAKRTERDEILKSRKRGFSALISAVLLHACATRPNTRAVVMSHESDATKRILRRVHDYIEHSALPIRVSRSSDNEIGFPDTKSWFYIGTAGARSFGRGDDLTHLHLSEKAHYQHPEMLAGVEEAMIKGAPTWIVSETTAKGAGTPHHKAWLKAIKGESSYRAHFYAWWQDPMNTTPGAQAFVLDDEEKRLKDAFGLTWDQLMWRRLKVRDMSNPELFPQEYPATWEEAFISSGMMVFDWSAVKRLDDTKLPVKWRGHIVDKGSSVDILPDANGPMRIFKTPLPNPRKRYLIVSDTADGVVGGAYSCADVYDPETWEQVAQWHGHADPIAFAGILARMGAFYGWAVIAVENNYPGNAVLGQLSEMGYPNLYSEDDLGWKTTTQSRAQFISDGRAAVKDGSIRVNSEVTISEMRTFVLAENGKMEAQAGCFSDSIIVVCKAASILKNWHFEPEEERKNFRDVLGLPRRRRNIHQSYTSRVV